MTEDDGWLYLDVADLERICEWGGLGPIQDARKLDSACARPRQQFGGHTPYTDAPSKAAALGWGLVSCHGLVDGNKRLGAIATVLFLHVNGYDVAMTVGEMVALNLQVARGDMDQVELCMFLRARIVRAPHGGTRAWP